MAQAVLQQQQFSFLSFNQEPKHLVDSFAIRVEPPRSWTVVSSDVYMGEKRVLKKGAIFIQAVPHNTFMEKPVYLIRNRGTGQMSYVTRLEAGGEVEIELSSVFHDKAWRAVASDYRP